MKAMGRLKGDEEQKFIIKGRDPLYEPSEYGLGYEYFHCMKNYEDKVAQYVVETGEVDTYGKLLKRSIRTALKLKAKGITKNDIVAICTENHIHSVVPFIASLFLGVPVVSLDQTPSVVESTYLLKQVKPKIIFVSLSVLEVIEKALKNAELDTEIVVFGCTDKYTQFLEFIEACSNEDSFSPYKSVNNKETAVILFSSGTTGLPKCICLSHYSLMAQIINSIVDSGETCKLSNYNKSGPDNRTIFLCYSSLYWISGVGVLTKCIFTGAARCVCSKFVPEDQWKVIDQYKVNVLLLTPSLMADILNTERNSFDISSVQVIGIGGSRLPQPLLKTLFKAFPYVLVIPVYGQTEIAGVLTTKVIKPEDVQMENPTLGSCGRPVAGITYKVVDPETEEIIGPNMQGELRYKSKMVMNGYYNMDSSSAFDSDGWLKTGDIVYYDQHYFFYVVDRIKEMFKYRDWHIVPAFLEGILLKHPSVKQAAVFGVPHEQDGEHPMAVVVLKKNCTNTTELEIEKFVEDQVLDRQRLRAGIKIVTDIPKTDTGKILRRRVKEMVLKGEI